MHQQYQELFDNFDVLPIFCTPVTQTINQTVSRQRTNPPGNVIPCLIAKVLYKRTEKIKNTWLGFLILNESDLSDFSYQTGVLNPWLSRW